MKCRLLVLCAVVWAVAATSAMAVARCSQRPSIESRATALVERIVAQDFAGAHAQFGEVLKARLPASGLQRSWETLVGRAGSFKSLLRVKAMTSGAYRVVSVGCSLEKAPVDVRVVFAEDDSIEGLFFIPFKADR